MTDPLRFVWARADDPERVYGWDEVALWPPGAVDCLQAWGLLTPAANATSVVCDACGGAHVETVITVDSPPGTGLRAYIRCPEAGRVSVPLDRLKCWEVNFSALAKGTASALATAGIVEEIIPSRIWLLGKTNLAGRSHEVFLARGLTWPDGPQIIGQARRLVSSPRRLVLVPGSVPAAAVWPCEPYLALSLPAILSAEGNAFTADLDLLESAVSKGGRAKPPRRIASFPTPSGAVWEDVRITLGEHRLSVEVRGLRREYSFEEAGFEERRRGGVPDRLWTLLKVFAVRGGIIPFGAAGLDKGLRTNLKQNVNKLGGRLAALLHIDDRPYKDARQMRRYETRFRISMDGLPIFPTPEGATWDAVSVAEVRPEIVAVSVDVTDRFVTYVRGRNGQASGQWEGAERTGEARRQYDLCSLGLAGIDGKPNATGEALLAVLRNGGKVRREQDDAAMLALCKSLTRLMQISKPPFQFSPGRQTWAALFEAASIGG